MLRAMKFNESGLKCWPYQCNVVLSQTYSSSGDYLWNVNCSGNVTESRGGGRGRKVEEGGGDGKQGGTESRGGGGGRVTQIGRGFLTKETGISSDSNTRQSRRHTSLYASVITKKTKTKTKNKVLVTVKSFSPVYLSILISSRVLILIGESR